MENQLSDKPNAHGAAIPAEPPGPWPVSFDLPPPAVEKSAGLSARPQAGKPQADTFTVYVDGSSLKNPGPSGFAALIIWPDGQRQTIAGGAPYSTNNRMELRATIAALEALPEDAQGELRADARYVVDGVNEWRRKWETRGFLSASKKPVVNRRGIRPLFLG